MAAKKPRAKTGEARKTNQPLKIDRLPQGVIDAILYLRNMRGRTWLEIEAQSAEPWAEDWASTGKGFIDWPVLPYDVLLLFPDLRLPHTSLHRWYDLRVSQVSREVLLRSKQAQIVAESFVKAGVAGDEEAVINAARDTLMGVLAEDGTAAGRGNAAKGLIKLGELMQKARANDLRERKVEVEEQTLQIKLDEIKRRTAELVKTADGDPETGAPAMTRDEVLRTVKDIYGVA